MPDPLLSQFISATTRKQMNTVAQGDSVACQRVWPMKPRPSPLNRVPAAAGLWGFCPHRFHSQLFLHSGLEAKELAHQLKGSPRQHGEQSWTPQKPTQTRGGAWLPAALEALEEGDGIP